MKRQEFINHYSSSIAGKRDAKQLMKNVDIFLNSGPNRYGCEPGNLNPQQEEYLKMAWEAYDNDEKFPGLRQKLWKGQLWNPSYYV